MCARSAFSLIALGKAFRASIRARQQDESIAGIGSILVASMLATFFFTWTAGVPGELWMLAGFSVAYARLVATGPSRAP